jgi:hypothetical protein
MAVMIGQKVGIGELSVRSAMEMDPLIKDPESEMVRIQMEGIRKALLSGLEQQAVQGQLDPATIARIAQKLGDGRTNLETAVAAVHQEMQKEQADKQNAQAQQAQPQPGMPPMGGAPQGQPEAQPEDQAGMAAAMGGAGTPEGQAPISAPPQGAMNLKDLLGALHNPAPAQG